MPTGCLALVQCLVSEPTAASAAHTSIRSGVREGQVWWTAGSRGPLSLESRVRLPRGTVGPTPVPSPGRSH